MAEAKTKETKASVDDFLNAVEPAVRQADGKILRQMMEEVTGKPARLWGPNIIGFGHYTYKYASGRTGDWPLVGFSPRKAKLSVYLSCGSKIQTQLLAKLGKHSMGKSCLYINKLADVDLDILRQLIQESAEESRKAHT